MNKFNKACVVAAAVLAGILPAKAQTGEADLYELSLEELMNVSVVSASKEKERLFDAPVAAYSVTREEIVKAGAWSIPEALRLVPGVIVREISNGNYDIHLRGFDNTMKYGGGTNQINSLTLVMINNRPVFNYNIGGTSWDALPIDIADVERIEVVCGPSAPLFGPNAVSGVINIITRDFKQQELLVSGQLQGSLPGGSVNSSLAVGKQLTNKLSLGVSGNYQQSLRLDDESYVYANPMMGSSAYYMKSDELAKAMSDNLVDPEVSLLRKGLNAYISFNPSEKISFDFSSGLQQAESQKILITDRTPLSFAKTNSYYANLNTKIYDLTLRTSYLKGTDDLNRLSEIYSSAYDFQVMDVAADYDLKLHSTLRVRPSVGYQATRYNDADHLEGYYFGGSLNGDHRMNNLSASLRADYTPLKGLRLIASSRIDKFDVNDDVQLSYQFATTYAINEKVLLRAVHGKSYSSLFYLSAFSNVVLPMSADGSLMLKVIPDKEINPSSNTMSELGLRAQLLPSLQMDVTVFRQQLEDVSTHLLNGYEQEGEVTYVVTKPSNLPQSARQLGATASVNWVVNKQWQLRPFVTLQQTELQNFGPNRTTEEHTNTPAVFGGIYANVSPTSKFNLNTSVYYFGNHIMSTSQDIPVQHAEGNIEGKFLLNARASYQLINNLNVFIGGRNLLNRQTREYYGTDRMGAQYFAGIAYNL